MAIKTNYNFKGIEVKDVIIRVDRLWGSSKENWTALVGVYNLTQEEVPAIAEVTEQRIVTEATEEAEAIYETVVVTPAIEASTRTVYNKLEEFNHSALYNEEERGYVSIYKSLTEKYGGIKI